MVHNIIKTQCYFYYYQVLEEGKVAQYGSPIDILQDESGIFHQMVYQHGRENFLAFKQMVLHHNIHTDREKTLKENVPSSLKVPDATSCYGSTNPCFVDD